MTDRRSNAPAPAFPGATSVSELTVYAGRAPDGLAGGTPHLHTASAEAYLVISGRGRLQTIDGSGFAVRALAAGSLVWFDPGVIHRVVNDGDLRVHVIMQNAALPEAGDAVMTFPDDVLADAARYRAAASLPGPDRTDAERLTAALARRDLGVRGFLELLDAAGRVDESRLARLHQRAVELVAPRTAEWRERWQSGALAVAGATGDRLDAIDAGRDPGLSDARVASVAASDAFGMCGRLRRYATAPTPKEHDA